jgi:hypothetical protein
MVYGSAGEYVKPNQFHIDCSSWFDVMQSQVTGPVSLIVFLVSGKSHSSASEKDHGNEFCKPSLGQKRTSSGVCLVCQVRLGLTITGYNSLRYKIMVVFIL